MKLEDFLFIPSAYIRQHINQSCPDEIRKDEPLLKLPLWNMMYEVQMRYGAKYPPSSALACRSSVMVSTIRPHLMKRVPPYSNECSGSDCQSVGNNVY